MLPSNYIIDADFGVPKPCVPGKCISRILPSPGSDAAETTTSATTTRCGQWGATDHYTLISKTIVTIQSIVDDLL